MHKKRILEYLVYFLYENPQEMRKKCGFLRLKKRIKSLKLILRQEDLTRIQLSHDQRKSQNPEPLQVANGHDLVRVLIMLTLWGRMNLAQIGMINKEELINNLKPRNRLMEIYESTLRIAYDIDFFRTSTLYRQIRVYEQTKRIQFLKP